MVWKIELPQEWEDLLLAIIFLFGFITTGIVFISPLVVAVLWLQTPGNFIITSIYSSLFCYTVFRIVKSYYRRKRKEEQEEGADLVFRVEGD